MLAWQRLGAVSQTAESALFRLTCRPGMVSNCLNSSGRLHNLVKVSARYRTNAKHDRILLSAVSSPECM